MYETAGQCWQRLSGIKEPLLTRTERHASLTIPKICLPDGFDAESTDQTHDYQSIGAQAVNHLTNKIMLALFAPSRPFFRIGAGKKTEASMTEAGIKPEDIATILAQLEREAVKELDARAQRPKLYATIRHLIITGNVLLVLDDESMRVMGLRYYCVKRDSKGALHTLVIKERLKFDELQPSVRAACSGRYHDDTFVDHYRYIRRLPSGDYGMSQWVNEDRLPTNFDGKWPANRLPYRVLTWDLSDESDYGTGLVEEYCGDLEAMSVLSESVVDGAVLGTEYRWLVNPTGQTSPEELNASKNGDAVAGKPEDIQPSQGGNPTAITVADNVLQRYERRIALGFLMQAGVTRDAERVTAEEIRLTANELETAFGGVYSALATDIQTPIAHWLLVMSGADIGGTDLNVSIITGLDALSRNGDLENLRLAFMDMGALLNVPEMLQARIKWNPLAKFVGDGRGINILPFIMTDEEWKEANQAAQQQRVAEAAATATGEAVAANQQGTPQ